MKRWHLGVILAAFLLLAGADRRLENSRRYQNVKHALLTCGGDLPTLDRVLIGLLA